VEVWGFRRGFFLIGLFVFERWEFPGLEVTNLRERIMADQRGGGGEIISLPPLLVI
jgi:hypothetical protein